MECPVADECDTNPEVSEMAKSRDIIHRPADHVKRATGPLMFMHRSVRSDPAGAMLVTGAALFAGLVLTGFVTLIAWCVTYVATTGPIDWVEWMLWSNGVLGPLLTYIGMTLMASSYDTQASKSFDSLSSEAKRRLSAIDASLGESLKEMMRDVSDETDDLRRITMLRLAETQMQFAAAVRQAGSGDKTPLMEVRDDTLKAIASSAIMEHEGIRRIIDERDADKARTALIGLRAGVSDALSLGAASKRAASPVPFVSTGSARHNLLVQKGEKALMTNPDLVDSNGGRLDELLHVHMPRILQTHAESSRRAGLKSGREVIEAMAQADARLDAALASIGRSIQEAVESLNDESGQALAREVRFLNMRRGEADEPALTL